LFKSNIQTTHHPQGAIQVIEPATIQGKKAPSPTSAKRLHGWPAKTAQTDLGSFGVIESFNQKEPGDKQNSFRSIKYTFSRGKPQLMNDCLEELFFFLTKTYQKKPKRWQTKHVYQ